MLADSAEGARREVPQLMQVGRHEMRMIRVRWSDRCGSRKGELVIMMLERVAPQLMRVRRKKGTDLRNYLRWDQHLSAGAIAERTV